MSKLSFKSRAQQYSKQSSKLQKPQPVPVVEKSLRDVACGGSELLFIDPPSSIEDIQPQKKKHVDTDWLGDPLYTLVIELLQIQPKKRAV